MKYLMSLVIVTIGTVWALFFGGGEISNVALYMLIAFLIVRYELDRR